MKFAVASSVLVNYPIDCAIGIVAEAGYDGVDIWGGRPHVYRKDYTNKELIGIQSRIDNLGLKVPSFMPAFYRYPHSLSSPNDIVSADSIDYMCICADNAAILGAELLLVVPGRSLFGQDRIDAFSRLVDSIHTVCEYCEQYALSLGVEPANTAVTDLVVTHKDALNVLKYVNHPLLGVVMDTGHMYLNREDLSSMFDKLGDKLLQLHVNDNDGTTQQNNIPGNGSFNFEHFIKETRKRRYDRWLSIELGFQYTTDPVPALYEAKKWLNALIREMDQ